MTATPDTPTSGARSRSLPVPVFSVTWAVVAAAVGWKGALAVGWKGAPLAADAGGWVYAAVTVLPALALLAAVASWARRSSLLVGVLLVLSASTPTWFLAVFNVLPLVVGLVLIRNGWRAAQVLPG